MKFAVPIPSKCPVCGKAFVVGERVVLRVYELEEEYEQATVEAVHEECPA